MSIISAERLVKKLGTFLILNRITFIDFFVRGSYIDFIARCLINNMHKFKRFIYFRLLKRRKMVRIKIKNVILQLLRSHNGVRKAKARRV